MICAGSLEFKNCRSTELLLSLPPLVKVISCLATPRQWAIRRRDCSRRFFASLPEEQWGNGSLRLHKTFRKARFSSQTVNRILGWEMEIEELELIAIWSSEGPQVFQIDPEHIDLLAAVNRGERPNLQEHREAIDALLDVGILIWLPN